MKTATTRKSFTITQVPESLPKMIISMIKSVQQREKVEAQKHSMQTRIAQAMKKQALVLSPAIGLSSPQPNDF